jgi:hypothetical protein
VLALPGASWYIERMFDDGDGGVATAVVARLSALIDELQGLDLTTLPGDDVLAVLRDLEVQKRRLATVDHALIAEIDSRGLAHEHACRNTAALLTQLVRVSPSEATGRVRAAADLGPRRGLTGQVLPPVFAQVAAAQAAGVISGAHARIVTATIDALPAAVQVEHEQWVQQFLVEQASELDPALLKQVARRITDTLDPDGTLTEERDRARRRDLTVRQRRDGSAHLDGELTAICAEALLSVLDSLAKPTPVEDGTRDPRTPGQRNHDGLHDGLHDALLAVLRSGELPACNGVAATIVLTMTEQQAETRTGLVTTGHGALISVDQALTLTGDARVMPVTLTKTREIAAYGEAHRIFTEGQRLAMIARDQGCSFPGCSVGPAWCQVHITDFAISRRTSVDDGTLLCGFHHREHPTSAGPAKCSTAPPTGPHPTGSTPPKPHDATESTTCSTCDAALGRRHHPTPHRPGTYTSWLSATACAMSAYSARWAKSPAPPWPPRSSNR